MGFITIKQPSLMQKHMVFFGEFSLKTVDGRNPAPENRELFPIMYNVFLHPMW